MINKNSDYMDETIDAIKFFTFRQISSKIYDKEKTINKTINKIIKCAVYFIPNYNIEIHIKPEFYEEFETSDYVDIKATNKPQNVYKIKNDGDSYEAILENIKVEKKWVEKCLTTYKIQEQIKTLKNQIYFEAPDDKSNFEKTNDLFKLGMKCFESNNYELGRTYFLKCLESLNGDTTDEIYILSHYNIACCYARELNCEMSLLHLSNAVTNGYSDWAHVIIDRDMDLLLENQHFIQLIKLMMQKNPKRKIIHSDVLKEINFIDIFLKKNNLDQFEKN